MTVTKVFTFDMGHRLSNYQGKCRKFHGHTYILYVTLEGVKDKLGMVIDFSALKDLVQGYIDGFDHRMLVKAGDELNEAVAKLVPEKDWFVFVNYNPTVENIAQDIYNTISGIDVLMINKVHVKSVKLYETPTSFAEVDSYVFPIQI